MWLFVSQKWQCYFNEGISVLVFTTAAHMKYYRISFLCASVVINKLSSAVKMFPQDGNMIQADRNHCFFVASRQIVSNEFNTLSGTCLAAVLNNNSPQIITAYTALHLHPIPLWKIQFLCSVHFLICQSLPETVASDKLLVLSICLMDDVIVQ